MRGAADLHTGLSELSLEQNILAAAKEHLRQSKKLGEEASLPRWHYRWHLAQARLQQADGKLAEALHSLDEADRQYVRGPVPDLRSMGAMKARVWVEQGRLSAAQHWAAEQGLSVDNDLSFLREFEHLTLARIRIAQYRRDGKERAIQEAAALLERLLKAAKTGERTKSVIEILVLQAVAHQATGDTLAALEPLGQA